MSQTEREVASSERPPVLHCADLVCGYEGRKVLHVDSLLVTSGESIALLGPNGSGKSTLLKTIVKSLPPVSISGRITKSLDYRQIARLVGYVPQEESTTFAFTVREMVTLGRLSQSNGIWDTDEDRACATAAMQQAGCIEFADRPVTSLSGGEKQRALIARALAQDCPLLLLDEPSSHLDASHQIEIAEVLHTLAREGRSVVAAIHDLNLVSQFAERAVLIGDQKILLDGTVEEVLSSSLLEDVYRVRFERLRTSDGKLMIAPMARDRS